MSLNFESLIQAAIKHKASDIHILTDSTPFLRINGSLVRVDGVIAEREEVEQIVAQIVPTRIAHLLESNRGVDFSYQYRNMERFRCVAFYEKERLGLAMRCIPMKIPTLDELEMPEVLKSIARIHRGMVLLTGITGSGKSTTLAAMINHLNNLEARRVITMEDPIEDMYAPAKCIISQREVGDDIPDFATGLRQALRMDPDVILIGEMRDLETIRVAIKAAETGHLLLSTLHTTGAVHTIQRIIGHYPDTEHDLVREQLSLNLKASITQRLVKKADGSGRMAAQEIMVVTDVIAKLIRENRIPDIFPIIRSREAGMQTFDQALADLVRANKITFEEGKKFCEDFYAYRRFIRGVQSSGDKGAILSAG